MPHDLNGKVPGKNAAVQLRTDRADKDQQTYAFGLQERSSFRLSSATANETPIPGLNIIGSQTVSLQT